MLPGKTFKRQIARQNIDEVKEISFAERIR